MALKYPILALLILLSLPATARAQGCESLPGRSALDQYCQAIPDGQGGNSSAPSSEPDRTVRESAPSTTTRQLADAGEDGDVLLGLPSAEGAAPGGPGAATAGSRTSDGTGSASVSGDGRTTTKASGKGAGAEPSRSGGKAGGETARVAPAGPPSSDLLASSSAARLDVSWLIAIGLGAIALIAGVTYFRRKVHEPK